MDKQYVAALTLFAVAALVGPADSQPPPNKPLGAPPPANPAPAPTAPPKDTGVPNTPGYPAEIGGKGLEEWIKAIDSPDPSVREEAIKVVVQFGPPARRAIPALVRQVRQLNDLSPQASAIIALSELVPLAPPTAPGSPPDGYTKDSVDALIQALDSTQAIIRYRAATALTWLGPSARAAVPKLIARVDDRSSWEIRKSVCAALGVAGRDDQGWPLANALEALGKGASDRDSRNVRLEALQSIINLGPLYGGVSPPQLANVLRQRLTAEKDKAVLIWVRTAFMRLDPTALTDANVAIISKQLPPKSGVGLEVRVQAAKALGYMGPAAKPALSDMIDALQQSDERVLTVQLCWSLARMGQFAERAIPALNQVQVAHKDDKDDWLRSSAKAAVETIEKAIQQAKAAPPAAPMKP
jgi:HEAT repeat protein